MHLHVPSTISLAVRSSFSDPPLHSSFLRLLQNRPNHLIPHLRRLRKPRLKVPLDAFKFFSIRIEMPQTDSLTPVACGEREFKIIGAERIVVDGGFNCLLKEGIVAEEGLSYAKPHTKELLTISPGDPSTIGRMKRK